jgi:transcriptional regulator with GAF, ATPase, and Fis domain
MPSPAGTEIASEKRAERPTLDAAFDAILHELGGGDEPLFARIERELITRSLALENGDEVKAAKRLGLTRAALQKRAKDE